MMTIDGAPFWITNESAGNLLALLKLVNCDDTPAQNIWTLNLFRNDVDLTCITEETDLTSAGFDGYASIPLWNETDDCDGLLQGVHELPDGTMALFVDQQVFTVTGASDPNTIYGAYVANAAGGILWIKKFETPAVMAEVGDVLKVSGLLQIACSVPLPEDLP